MKKPEITREKVKTIYENRFLKVFDLQYEEGKHYFDATRRSLDDLTAIKSEDELKKMIPDAVSCVLILKLKGKEPVICLNKEYRFPAGQFLLSVPAGLIDKEDKAEKEPVFSAAAREIQEETGIKIESTDEMTLINPLLFSTPGMTDESNAVVKIVLNRDEMPKLTQEGAVGGECFDGFTMVTKEEAKKILKAGTDEKGIFYSTYTWIALMTFVSDIW